MRTIHFTRLPLYLQVIIGVAAGTVMGVNFGTENYAFGLLNNAALGQLGQSVIRLLKALAAPLVFFAILEALATTDVGLKHGRRLLILCSLNLSVAMVIGLTLMNSLEPGRTWEGRLPELAAGLDQPLNGTATTTKAAAITLDPLKNILGYIPESLATPFVTNNVIAIILLALLGGSALRRLKNQSADDIGSGLETVEQLISVCYRVLVQMLLWVVKAVPFAVFGVVAQVVGKSGLDVFGLVSIFLLTMLAGLMLHALVYYPSLAKWAGKMSISRFFGLGADAIVTGLSTNSSLATMPVTLRCLTERMGISNRSARLSVCVGTNLNNDGIILYEAMAALFLAQAIGYDLNLMQQATIVAAAVMVGVGISGVPEAGLIALPLVLSTAGLPDALVVTAIPLITTVDWIIARCRSGVNVINDMLIAILLDRLDHQGAKKRGVVRH